MSALSDTNRDLVQRVAPDVRPVVTHRFSISIAELSALLDAARQEGLERGRDEAAEDAAGEDL